MNLFELRAVLVSRVSRSKGQVTVLSKNRPFLATSELDHSPNKLSDDEPKKCMESKTLFLGKIEFNLTK